MPKIVLALIIGLLLAVPLGRLALSATSDTASETARLLGSWDCSTSGSGSSSTALYRRVNETTLELTMQVRTAAGVTGSVRERFAYDRASGVWSLDGDKSRFYQAEHLEAGAWTAPEWTFTGTEIAQGKTRTVRIVYADSLPDTFVREHQAIVNGRWTADGTFSCRRSLVDARYDEGLLLSEVQNAPSATATPLRATNAAAASPTPRRPSAAPTVTARPAARVATRNASPERASGGTPVDRAYELTQGIWDCKTFGGAAATHTYTRKADGTIELHNVLSIAKHAYTIDETYRFDRATARWTAATSGGAYAGSASRWTGDTWVFNGDMPLGGHRVPVQMIYSRLGDRAFRRDFVRVQDGAPATFAAETCVLRQRA